MKTRIEDTNIGALLGDLQKGKFIEEVDEKLKEVGARSAEIGGNARLTITVNFTTDLGKSGSSIITASVNHSLPKQKPKPMMRFVTPSGLFVKEDMEQTEMSLENVHQITLGGEAVEDGSKKRKAN